MLYLYFKERRGFDRLFALLKQKYISLNRFSGTVTLKNITEIESKDLSNFFGMTIEQGSTFKTSFTKIEKKLKETKYSDFTWDELFKNYFEKQIVTKKEKSEMFKKEETLFYQRILKQTPEELKSWFETIIQSKNEIFQVFLRKYKKNKQSFETELLNLLKIILKTKENNPTSLTILASTSSNPHFLDLGTPTSNLFFKLTANYYQKKEPKTTIEKIKFLSDLNIYIDTLSNFVIIYNFKSDSELINTFTKEKQPLNLNLNNILTIGKIDTDLKKVLVFENPSMLPVFAKYNIPIIISYGNPNFAFYKVIEKLIETKNQIYYNGDFDPEGLVIAANICEKFPQIKLFCYQKEDYFNSKSKNLVSESRLKKLDNIKLPELKQIKELLKKEKSSAYQEKNIQNIENYIKKII